MSMNFITEEGYISLWNKVKKLLFNKVDKEDGKGLSSNDFTTNEKNKLNNIEAEANKIIIDTEMSLSSENPVQNKIIKNEIDNINIFAGQLNTKITNIGELVGETPVSTQITDAINNKMSTVHTPVKGVDYWTDEDKEEMIADVIAAIPDGDSMTF